MTDKRSATRANGTATTPATNSDSETDPTGTDRVLVIAGEEAAKRVTVSRISAAGYTVEAAETAEEARSVCAQRLPSLIILDLDVKRAGGLPLLKELKENSPDLPIIVTTNLMWVEERGVRATQLGAFSYLVKPVEKSELLDHVRRAIGVAASAPKEHDWRADLAARSQLREERVMQVNAIAARDAHVLITGENSLGRELVARAIHAASARRARPLLVLRCATGDEGEHWLDPDLLSRSVLKALGNAKGGMLMIDGIDSLPVETQRILAKSVDEARLIATSSFPEHELVHSGRLHDDLFALVAQQSLCAPPLGRRREDLPLLVNHFLEQAVEPGGVQVLYTPDAVAALVARSWPANIRELFDLVLNNPSVPRTSPERGNADSMASYDEAREAFSRQYLSETLRVTEGNVSKSARLAKRRRTDFYKLMAKYRLRADDFKRGQTEH